MVTLDEEYIRKIRLRARVLRHDHALSKRKISRIMSEEFGLPFNTVRYYAFIIGNDWKREDKKIMTFDALTIKKWRRRAGGLKHDFRLSKRRICQMVANEFNVPLTTARYYLFDKDKRYPRQYDLQYKRLIRHIDSFLPQVFNGNSELQLGQISNGIENLSGISLKEGTLEKLLFRCESKQRGSPIIKTETGNYRLNELFYKN